MMKEYKADFFYQYSELLESLYHLRSNGIHKLIEGEIDELIGNSRDIIKIIRWVKNKFTLQDLFSKESEDDEDSVNGDSEIAENSDDTYADKNDSEVTDTENEDSDNKQVLDKTKISNVFIFCILKE